MAFALDMLMQLAATALLLYGLYHMGNSKLRGPFYATASELLWVLVGFVHAIPGLMLLSAILTVMQLRNFIKWCQENRDW